MCGVCPKAWPSVCRSNQQSDRGGVMSYHMDLESNDNAYIMNEAGVVYIGLEDTNISGAYFKFDKGHPFGSVKFADELRALINRAQPSSICETWDKCWS